MFRTKIAAFALALLPSAASAGFPEAQLSFRSTQMDVFSIPYMGRSSPRDFWCAAGDYVVSELNLSPNTPIYRLTPTPGLAGDGVRFSLTKRWKAASGAPVAPRQNVLRAGDARSLCVLRGF